MAKLIVFSSRHSISSLSVSTTTGRPVHAVCGGGQHSHTRHMRIPQPLCRRSAWASLAAGATFASPTSYLRIATRTAAPVQPWQHRPYAVLLIHRAKFASSTLPQASASQTSPSTVMTPGVGYPVHGILASMAGRRAPTSLKGTNNQGQPSELDLNPPSSRSPLTTTTSKTLPSVFHLAYSSFNVALKGLHAPHQLAL